MLMICTNHQHDSFWLYLIACLVIFKHEWKLSKGRAVWLLEGFARPFGRSQVVRHTLPYILLEYQPWHQSHDVHHRHYFPLTPETLADTTNFLCNFSMEMIARPPVESMAGFTTQSAMERRFINEVESDLVRKPATACGKEYVTNTHRRTLSESLTGGHHLTVCRCRNNALPHLSRQHLGCIFIACLNSIRRQLSSEK